MAFITVPIPLNNKNMAPKQAIIPKINIGMYSGWSWLLNALKITEGPMIQSGSAPARYLSPFNKISLFVRLVIFTIF